MDDIDEKDDLFSALWEDNDRDSRAMRVSVPITGVGLVLGGFAAAGIQIDLTLSILTFLVTNIILFVMAHFFFGTPALRVFCMHAEVAGILPLIGATLFLTIEGLPLTGSTDISRLLVAYTTLCVVGILGYLLFSVRVPDIRPSSLRKLRVRISIAREDDTIV